MIKKRAIKSRPKKRAIRSRPKLYVGNAEHPPEVITFRGRRYWNVGNAFSLKGAKNMARKWMRYGYRVRIIDAADYPATSVYVRPRPSPPKPVVVA